MALWVSEYPSQLFLIECKITFFLINTVNIKMRPRHLLFSVTHNSISSHTAPFRPFVMAPGTLIWMPLLPAFPLYQE